MPEGFALRVREAVSSDAEVRTPGYVVNGGGALPRRTCGAETEVHGSARMGQEVRSVETPMPCSGLCLRGHMRGSWFDSTCVEGPGTEPGVRTKPAASWVELAGP